MLLAFVVWRYTSVARGAKARDKAIVKRLDPLAERFEAGVAVSAEEVELASVGWESREAAHPDKHKYRRECAAK
ncbi:hypothetical protein AGMMS50256_05040 [Betaproteobacteria bacterium]|nr:hypothetical protein AGMMS50256_05040 [Betaproteobacteria bacterium]